MVTALVAERPEGEGSRDRLVLSKD